MNSRRAALGGALAAMMTLAALESSAAATSSRPVNGRPAGVVLWNTLGSVAHVQQSRIGPGGTVTGGSYVPGRFGNAYQADHAQDFKLTFPGSVVSRYSGTIELWAKLSGFTPVIRGGGGNQPLFFLLHDPRGHDGYYMFLTANDGAGGGGLSGFVGDGTETATGPFGDWTYQRVLGGNVSGWHHYALVWNSAGIRGVADGTRKVAVFVDGRLSSTRWGQQLPFGPISSSAVLQLASINRVEHGAVAIDNLIVWNCAVTNFAGRNVQKPAPRTCA